MSVFHGMRRRPFLIADNLKRITQDDTGPASRYVHVGTAVSGGTFSGDAMARRLLNLTGGYLEYYHSVSLGHAAAATPYTYGVAASGNSMDTLLDTKLVILWGHNPTETIFGHTNYFFQKMKQNGTRFIVVDPRYSDTVSSLADQWIPLLPTTDNALMDAMMYVIISENLHEIRHLSTHILSVLMKTLCQKAYQPTNRWLPTFLAQKMGYTKRRNGQKKLPTFQHNPFVNWHAITPLQNPQR